MRCFADEFGDEAVLRDVALPTRDFFPAPYTAGPEQIEALLFRVRDLMAVAPRWSVRPAFTSSSFVSRVRGFGRSPVSVAEEGWRAGSVGVSRSGWAAVGRRRVLAGRVSE
jgi:hypothetical protein